MTPHFSKAELQCHCGCHKTKMDPDFLVKLEDLRRAFNKPISPSSAYRCPSNNTKISKTGQNGPHTTGKAIDIPVSGEDAYDLVQLAFLVGFSGIGISQRGPHKKRFIHLDTLHYPDYPRPRIWTY